MPSPIKHDLPSHQLPVEAFLVSHRRDSRVQVPEDPRASGSGNLAFQLSCFLFGDHQWDPINSMLVSHDLKVIH
jgi:hypothetical protein